MTAVRMCILMVGAFAIVGATGKDAMGPLSRYLMDRTAEIAIARSAAPGSISSCLTQRFAVSERYVPATFCERCTS